MTAPDPGEPIAIIGMSALFAGADSLSTLWRNIVEGVDSITDAPPARIPGEFFSDHESDRLAPDRLAPDRSAPDRLGTRRGGFVDDLAWFDPAAFGVMPVAVAEAEPDQLLALRLASQAVEDAGGMAALGEAERTAVILGRGGYLNSGVVRLEQRTRISHQVLSVLRQLVPDLDDRGAEAVRASLEQGLGEHHPESSVGLVPNLAASRVANRLDLGGPAYTVDAACASSLVAVEQAMGLLRAGSIDAAVVGGVHHCHDVTFWSVFSQLGALSPSGCIRPFSRRADGLLIGEGTGMLVLRRAADVRAEGIRCYAQIHGSGTASDGRGTSLFAPRVGGQLLALRRAWADAGLDPAEVGLIEAHGTATVAGDAAEIATLSEMFTGHDPITVGSIKSMIGHCMPAAGAAGLIKAALAVHHQVLPPTLHADEPAESLDGGRFELLAEAREWPAGRGRLAAVNAFGFGGINAHLVLGPAPSSPRHQPRVASPGHLAGRAPDVGVSLSGAPVVALAGPSSSVLGEWLAEARPGESLVRLEPGPARLMILEPSERRLAIAARSTAAGTPWRGRNDVWHVPEGLIEAGGAVAFVYPGVEPSFTPMIDGIASRLGIDPPSLVDDEGLGFQGANIVHLGRFLTAALGALGLSPTAIVGHSVGEWTAMIASGLIPEEELDRLLTEIDPATLEVPGVEFVALGCGFELAVELIESAPDLYLTHDNCPHQTIACGPASSVATLVNEAKKQRIMAQVLPFRSGFHSPVFEPFLGQVRAHLDGMAVVAPAVPLWSATTASPYPEGSAAVRALGIRHLVEPVRFRELVEALYASGVRAFVQVGVGSLPGFIADTLAGREHVVVSAGSERDSGLTQLDRVRAALWAEGGGPRSAGAANAANAAKVARSARPAQAAAGDVAAALPSAPSVAPRGVLLALGAPQMSVDPSMRLQLPAAADPASVAVPARLGASPAVVSPAVVSPTVVSQAVARSAPLAISPLLAELEALTAEAAAASSELANLVTSGARAHRRRLRRPRTVDGPGRPNERSALSRDGGSTAPTGVQPDPVERGPRSRRIAVSLAAMPWLADHCFYRQPADSADPALRFPVVPMTAICELMLDLAAETAPGLVPVALTDVRALRWLPAEPAHEVEVTIAEVDPSVDRNSDVPVERVLRMTIEGFARGTVHLASGYPSAPSVSVLNDSAPRSAPVEASDLYEHRWMFHGPRYQGVTAISQWFENGLVGTIAPLPSPGAVLDCAGQLMGLWAMQSLTENVLAFPQRIAAMRFFGPRPEVSLRCQVAVTSVSDRAVGADMELGTDDQVWCRIESWEDRRFDTDELLWPFLRFPETRTVVERQEPGWWLLRERWGDSASRELLVRRYATAEERRDYEAKNPLAQRDWLLGRAAAKDAVRQWLWAQGSGPRFPVEVEIGSAESGAPCIVEPPEARHLSVSIAHTAGVAVVQLAEGQAAGIDIERVERRSEHMVGVALRRSEREVMDRLAAEAADAGSAANDVATTILWALKEATAKASGRGLQGRPKDWTVVEAGGGTARIIETTPRPPQPTEPEDVPADADWALRYQVTDLNGSGDLVVVAWIECPTLPARERAAVVLPGEPNERESIDAEY